MLFVLLYLTVLFGYPLWLFVQGQQYMDEARPSSFLMSLFFSAAWCDERIGKSASTQAYWFVVCLVMWPLAFPLGAYFLRQYLKRACPK